MRGLKFFVPHFSDAWYQSHPVRVRGLKYLKALYLMFLFWSHPVRVRGLKYQIRSFKGLLSVVAPRAGAWIEIRKGGVGNGKTRVAPRAGAWIEIRTSARSSLVPLSHPVRVRGLKSVQQDCVSRTNLSHPVRVRGLKFVDPRSNEIFYVVAPRAGAWIEMFARRNTSAYIF